MISAVQLRKNEERRILSGHQWVFSNEITAIEGSPEPGDIVEVRRANGKLLGIGFYHPNSLIAVRMLQSNPGEVNTAFFRQRLSRALAKREAWIGDSTAYRIVHGESDRLPGLIVDRYADVLVVQAVSAGVDRHLSEIADALEDLLHPRGILARNDAGLRQLEHLPQSIEVLRGDVDPVEVVEHGLRYRVDTRAGQKTGLFLDQKANRAAIRPYMKGRRVLDCFCNDGGFSLNACAGGSVSTEGVDISAEAVARATANAALNGFRQATFLTGDAFTHLQERLKANATYDAVILDPPSFTKNKRTVATALHGYRRINGLALRLLSPGGILVSASCSHHVDQEAFLDMLRETALKAGRTIQILEFRGAAPDHPVLPAMPETSYLKCAIVAVD